VAKGAETATTAYSATPQPSLRGRNAWVLEQLLRIRGTNQAEVAAWVIDQWIDGPGREYLRSYDIDIRDFYNRANVVKFERDV
jgi:hypothetical protein